jgi:putative spermidine/putrescine transport system permease protein
MSESESQPRLGANALVALALVLYLLVPIGVLVWLAFAPSELAGVPSEQWAPGGPLRGFRYVIETYGAHVERSVLLSLAAAALSVLLGASAGVGLARTTPRTRALLESFLLLPLSVPGITVAVGLIVAYANLPALRSGPWLLLMGHALYTIPLAARAVAGQATATRLDELLDTAAALGARPGFRASHVLVPALRRGLLVASLLAAAVSWGEFNVSFLLATPLQATFPAALYQTYTSNGLQIGAAATVVFLAGLLPPLVLLQKLGATAPQAA